MWLEIGEIFSELFGFSQLDQQVSFTRKMFSQSEVGLRPTSGVNESGVPGFTGHPSTQIIGTVCSGLHCSGESGEFFAKLRRKLVAKIVKPLGDARQFFQPFLTAVGGDGFEVSLWEIKT